MMGDGMSDAEFLRSLAHACEIGDPVEGPEIARLRAVADKLASSDADGEKPETRQSTSTWPDVCPTCGGQWAIKSKTMGASHGQPHSGRCVNGHWWNER